MRFDDRGTKLNLFASEGDAQRYAASLKGSKPHRYAFGWIVKDATGTWWDADGRIGAGWQPDERELYACVRALTK